MYLYRPGAKAARQTRHLPNGPSIRRKVFHTRYKCNEAPRKSTGYTTGVRLIPRPNQRCLSVVQGSEYGCSRSYNQVSSQAQFREPFEQGPNTPQYEEPRRAQLTPVSTENKPIFGDPRRMAFAPPTSTPATPVPPHRKSKLVSDA